MCLYHAAVPCTCDTFDALYFIKMLLAIKIYEYVNIVKEHTIKCMAHCDFALPFVRM
jgi:hypothetical protein